MPWGFVGAFASAAAVLLLLSCAGTRPANVGVPGAGLAPCPPSPNCVSTDATDAAQRVAPLQLATPAPEAWREARAAVAALARTRVVRQTDDTLHAECRSRLFGFVDDLELVLRPAEGRIAVRSASRMGVSDLGVNRRRVEALREALRARGVVR